MSGSGSEKGTRSASVPRTPARRAARGNLPATGARGTARTPARRGGRACRYFATRVESTYCQSSHTRRAWMPWRAYMYAVRGLLSTAT